jgi:hypothetical protein
MIRLTRALLQLKNVIGDAAALDQAAAADRHDAVDPGVSGRPVSNNGFVRK